MNITDLLRDLKKDEQRLARRETEIEEELRELNDAITSIDVTLLVIKQYSTVQVSEDQNLRK